MPKKSTLVVLAVLAGGGYFLARSRGIDSFDKLAAMLKPAGTTDESGQPAVADRERDSIRVATLDLEGIGDISLDDKRSVGELANVVRQFDILALQNVHAANDRLLNRIIDVANSNGDAYAFVAGPTFGKGDDRRQFAYFFDQASVEVDRESVYTVDDPDDLFFLDPFAAPFRVRGPAAEEAFTFTLVNVRIDERRTEEEYSLLVGLYRAVRNDGRDEDDAIIIGSFGVDTRSETPPGGARFAWAIIPEDASSLDEPGPEVNSRFDNLLFDARATGEFTGLADKFETANELETSAAEGALLADRSPIWAEFSLVEHATP